MRLLKKTCSKCKTTKPIVEFHKVKSTLDGFHYWCKSCRSESAKERYKQNREAILLTGRHWYEKNKLRILEYRKKRQKQRRRTEPKFKFNESMSSGIYKALKGNKNGRKWESFVNYDIQQLMRHLEKLFMPGMSWENYGQWHIDHIIPISAFNFEKPEDIDFKRCWDLENLRPLWAHQNAKKHSSLQADFQPAMIF